MSGVNLIFSCFFLISQGALVAQWPATNYSGGRSTPLQAVLKIVSEDRVPIGIILGINPSLCNTSHDYSFGGMSTLHALQKAIQGTGYTVVPIHDGYQIIGSDLTRREEEVMSYKFDSFSSAPTTMSDLGARLTGFISDVVEGAGSFLIDNLGSPNDEVVSIPKFINLTAPEIANDIVGRGSRGVWIIQAMRADTGPKPGSTILRIYSYHDAASSLSNIACVAPLK